MPESPADSTRRTLALAGAFVLPPLLCRTVAVYGAGLVLAVPDLRGVASDLAVSLVLAAVAGALARLSRMVAALGLALWVLAAYGNLEHVRVLDANAALAYSEYLGDETFLRGSALAIRWGILAAVLAAAAVPAWFALRGPREWIGRVAFPVAALSLVVVAVVWPRDTSALRWRQDHFVLENLRALVQPAPDGGNVVYTPRERGDLSGTSWLPAAPRARNVLLVIVEGVSGAHIGPVARAQGWNPSYEMSALSALSQESVAYTNFVAMQRQTNRGLYALLCGDVPRLGTGPPRMSEYATFGGEPCLPSALADAGYTTAFVQAAPLAFMMKDQFMPRAGFERVIGADHFRRAYRRSRWGVDDRAFFEQSLEVLEELRQSDEPWFLTLLTSGTHHPFNVPESFVSPFPAESHPHAATYLDLAVGEFAAAIRERGVLEDTLVIFTSDESAGVQTADERERERSQSWGFSLVLAPGVPPARIAEPHAQLDVPVSVLDYLGREGEAAAFSGRSLFRRYDAPRSLVFANTYLRQVGGLGSDDQLHVCEEDLRGCRTWAVDRSKLFAPTSRQVHERSPRGPEFLAAAVARSRAPLQPESGVREFSLTRTGPVALESDTESFQWIFGGQNFAVPENTRIEVELDLSLAGPPGGARFIHDLASEGRRIFVRGLELAAGQRLRLAYTYATGPRMDTAVVRLWTQPNSRPSPGLTLQVERAQVRLVPAPPPAGGHPDRIELRRFDLLRADP